MKNWFPLRKNLLEGEEFRALTPAEKLYFLHVLSEFNLRGQFYKSDLEVAVTLGLSVDKVRKARRKVTALGWLDVRPGIMSKKGNLATTYHRVKWSDLPEEGSGEFFASMHRYAFEVMLAKIRDKTFTQVDVLVYVYLCYWWWRNRGKNEGKFFLTKKVLREVISLPNVPEKVRRLYEGFQFTGGVRLFEYTEEYHRLSFHEWNTFADPSNDEKARENAERRREDIRKRVAAKKAAKEEKPSDLAIYFRDLCGGTVGSRQKEWLVGVVKEHGAAKVAEAMSQFKHEGQEGTFSAFQCWWRRRYDSSA